MPQHYSDETRETDPHALPDVETFTGYEAKCLHCSEAQAVFPDYYGLTDAAEETCASCACKGLRVTDTKRQWYYWFCFPGCLPDSDPIGPFATEAEALADAREE